MVALSIALLICYATGVLYRDWTVFQTHHKNIEWNDLEESSTLAPMHFSSVVTARAGSSALLECVASNRGHHKVSWIRKRDMLLLTAGKYTYTPDQRFRAMHLKDLEELWLHIKYVQKRDAGIYECQVSSHPPSSVFIELRVVDADTNHESIALSWLLFPSTWLLLTSVFVSKTL